MSNFIPMISSSPPPLDDGPSFNDGWGEDDDFGGFTSATAKSEEFTNFTNSNSDECPPNDVEKDKNKNNSHGHENENDTGGFANFKNSADDSETGGWANFSSAHSDVSPNTDSQSGFADLSSPASSGPPALSPKFNDEDEDDEFADFERVPVKSEILDGEVEPENPKRPNSVHFQSTEKSDSCAQSDTETPGESKKFPGFGKSEIDNASQDSIIDSGLSSDVSPLPKTEDYPDFSEEDGKTTDIYNDLTNDESNHSCQKSDSCVTGNSGCDSNSCCEGSWPEGTNPDSNSNQPSTEDYDSDCENKQTLQSSDSPSGVCSGEEQFGTPEGLDSGDEQGVGAQIDQSAENNDPAAGSDDDQNQDGENQSISSTHAQDCVTEDGDDHSGYNSAADANQETCDIAPPIRDQAESNDIEKEADSVAPSTSDSVSTSQSDEEASTNKCDGDDNSANFSSQVEPDDSGESGCKTNDNASDSDSVQKLSVDGDDTCNQTKPEGASPVPSEDVQEESIEFGELSFRQSDEPDVQGADAGEEWVGVSFGAGEEGDEEWAAFGSADQETGDDWAGFASSEPPPLPDDNGDEEHKELSGKTEPPPLPNSPEGDEGDDDDWNGFSGTAAAPPAPETDKVEEDGDEWAGFSGPSAAAQPSSEKDDDAEWAGFSRTSAAPASDNKENAEGGDDWGGFSASTKDASPSEKDGDDEFGEFTESTTPTDKPATGSNLSSPTSYQVPLPKAANIDSAISKCFPSQGFSSAFITIATLADVVAKEIERPAKLKKNERQKKQKSSTPSLVNVNIWRHLENMENTNALTCQWSNSCNNQRLLKSLAIDPRNILLTKKQAVPIFASSLGLLEPSRGGVLEPTKTKDAIEPTLVDTSKEPTVQPTNIGESIPPVEFDWGSSGLTNPLDYVEPCPDSPPEEPPSSPTKPETTTTNSSSLLDLDFFTKNQKNYNVSAPSKSSAFENEFLCSIEPPKPIEAKTMNSLESLLSGMKFTTTMAKPKKDENISSAASKILASLPDLSFMQAKVLMFPVKAPVTE